MQQFESYGGQPTVVQKWQITADGGILKGARTAMVEVAGLIERPKVSANSYTMFATANACGAIDLRGNINTDSYDSSLGPPSSTTIQNEGNVGTNGNLTIQGSVSIHGICPRREPASGRAPPVRGRADLNRRRCGQRHTVDMPTAVDYPVPVLSATPPTTVVTVNAALLGNASTACSALGLTSGSDCTVNAVAKTITVDGHGTDRTLPSVVVTGGFKLDSRGQQPGQCHQHQQPDRQR